MWVLVEQAIGSAEGPCEKRFTVVCIWSCVSCSLHGTQYSWIILYISWWQSKHIFSKLEKVRTYICVKSECTSGAQDVFEILPLHRMSVRIHSVTRIWAVMQLSPNFLKLVLCLYTSARLKISWFLWSGDFQVQEVVSGSWLLIQSFSFNMFLSTFHTSTVSICIFYDNN